MQLAETITITIGDSSKKKNLKIRKTLDNSLMIFDHTYIDVYVVPKEHKVIALGKSDTDDTNSIYIFQDKLMDFLARKGVINPASIRAGNVFGSLEAQYLVAEIDDYDETMVLLYTISQWLDTQREFMDYEKELDKKEKDEFLHPDAEDSTEMDEIPQELSPNESTPKKIFGIY